MSLKAILRKRAKICEKCLCDKKSMERLFSCTNMLQGFARGKNVSVKRDGCPYNLEHLMLRDEYVERKKDVKSDEG